MIISGSLIPKAKYQTTGRCKQRRSAHATRYRAIAVCIFFGIQTFGAISGWAQDANDNDEATFEFDIAAQSLEQSTAAFARLTRYQFLFTQSDIRQTVTNEVSGQFSADNALKVMLFGTGINYSYANDNTVIFFRGEYSENSTEAAELSGTSDANDPGHGSGFVLEEMLVTARKREERLQDSPLSVSAFSEEQLMLDQITSTSELNRITPNLTFDSNAPTSGHSNAAQIFIRGIGQQEFLGVSDPGVGFYVDGVYYARTTATIFDLADIERVEVLRGPQGTLFGRNTIGGAIAIHTRKPTWDSDGNIKLKAGSDHLREIQLSGGGAVSEELAARVSVGSKIREGYVQRLQGGSALGDEDRFYARAGLLWKPAERFNVFLGLDYLRRDENGAPLVFGGVNLNASLPSAVSFSNLETGCPVASDLGDSRCWNEQYAAGAFANNGTFVTESALEHGGINLTAEWDLGERLQARSISAYRSLSAEASRDADNTPLQGFHTTVADEQKQFSQEFQLLGTTASGQLKWILGLYYFEEQIDNRQALFFGLDQSLQLDFEADNRAQALFGQATYDVNDVLSLTFGLRYTEERKEMLPDQRATGPVGFGGQSPGSRFVEQRLNRAEFSDASVVASLAYRWSEQAMGYVSYSEGFKSGGFNARNVSLSGTRTVSQFEPENAGTLELGLKSEWFERHLRLNAAAFITDYSDLHVTVRQGIAPTVFNGGEASIHGFEFEWAWVPTENWFIRGSLGHINARYDRIGASLLRVPGADIGVDEDDQLALTPEYTANLGLAYSYALRDWVVTPQLDWTYTSEKYFDAENNPFSRQAGINLFNASVMLNSGDQWEFVFAVSNLTDRTYKTAVTDASNTGLAYVEEVYARGREYSLQLAYNW